MTCHKCCKEIETGKERIWNVPFDARRHYQGQKVAYFHLDTATCEANLTAAAVAKEAKAAEWLQLSNQLRAMGLFGPSDTGYTLGSVITETEHYVAYRVNDFGTDCAVIKERK